MVKLWFWIADNVVEETDEVADARAIGSLAPRSTLRLLSTHYETTWTSMMADIGAPYDAFNTPHPQTAESGNAAEGQDCCRCHHARRAMISLTDE